MKTTVLLMAAGSGKRMGGSVKKQYIKLDGKEILRHTAQVFETCELIDEIVVVTPEDEVQYVGELLADCKKLKCVVEGGSERQYSVYNGLKAAEDCDIVLIHDGVRPFVTHKGIEDCVECVKRSGACVLGVPVKDTIKICDEDGNIVSTPKRSLVWAAQTPQCFSYNMIYDAYKKAAVDGFLGTDDASVAEYCGIEVCMVKGDYDNIKITTPEDIAIGEQILRKRAQNGE